MRVRLANMLRRAADRLMPGGYYCQNCSRVIVDRQGDICSECREFLKVLESDTREICPTCGAMAVEITTSGSTKRWFVCVGMPAHKWSEPNEQE